MNDLLTATQRGLQGFRTDDQQTNVRDQPGFRSQSFSATVQPGTVPGYLTPDPNGFPVGMVTVQAIPQPGGAVVGPVEIWFHQRAQPGNEPPFVVLFGSEPRQFFFGGQYFWAAARNNGPNPVTLNITISESI